MKCTIRKDLLNKGESVPVGNEYYGGTNPIEYRWVNETEFEVFYKGVWQLALSIDFDFPVEDKQKPTNLKRLSQNDLEELIDLIGRIDEQVEKYHHVSEYLPKNLVREITNFDNKIKKEFNRRFNET